MLTQKQLEYKVKDLIKQKQSIFEKLKAKKNRTTDKVEYYGKKLRTLQAKIDTLMEVVNG